tara:strand:- start:7189 stop:7965 length:777 start_codon:yes stop_codon:yes gene_type:complete
MNHSNTLDVLKKYSGKCDLIIDSGAFTAYKTGRVIKLSEYIDFINSCPFKMKHYANLDVIGDADASMENYEIMLREGLSPVPVFTRGAPVKHLEKYFESSEVVAVGGIKSMKNTEGFLHEVMKQADGRKIHWLGYGKGEMLAKYKPYSCDTSSWLSGLRYGSMSVYLGKGVFKSFSSRNAKMIRKYSGRIRKLNANPSLLADPEKCKGDINKNVAGQITLKSYVAYSDEVKEAFGVNYHLACAQWRQLEEAIKCRIKK